ncbi:uncharacterized protein LOC119978349 isoform X2 [Scyliorhinus canicula]|uniref:uncharacterized protein LOC119978349 isoform X2 n=1 Tax=Scyliorhinus canicula TaxID=7830 RepID=UPI0018F77157|nr:uncharacterized protein LOC119978349 isoform X2 [Scyliorhinus canicula]
MCRCQEREIQKDSDCLSLLDGRPLDESQFFLLPEMLDFFWSTYSNGNLSSLITTVKVIEEEQRVIDNIEKKLMEIEMKIKTCEISLFTMLKDCINGK